MAPALTRSSVVRFLTAALASPMSYGSRKMATSSAGMPALLHPAPVNDALKCVTILMFDGSKRRLIIYILLITQCGEGRGGLESDVSMLEQLLKFESSSPQRTSI